MKTEFGNATIDPYGYYRIVTRKEGNYGIRLHRLIYEKYVGEIPKGYQIHHKDNNKLNNSLDNLECVSLSEHNRIHEKGKATRFKRGTSFIDKHGGLNYLKEMKAKGKNMSEIARDLNYKNSSAITQWLRIRGLTWSEI